MFCPYCGSEVKEGHLFCFNCGKQMDVKTENNNAWQKVAVQSYQNNDAAVQNDYREWNERERAKNLPKGWFKFLIYFALFANAALCVIQAILFVTGSVYGKDKDAVYAVFPNLKTINICICVLLILLAVYCIIVRFRLAGFYRSGPPMLILMHIASIALVVTHMFLVHFNTGYSIADIANNNIIPLLSIVENAILCVANYIYFKRRKAMFNK